MTYITLPSNACPHLFPDNVTGNYITQLPKELDFTDGIYEVGLAEIIFPHCFFQILKNDWILMEDGAPPHKRVKVTFEKPLHFLTREKLIKHINDRIDIARFRSNFSDDDKRRFATQIFLESEEHNVQLRPSYDGHVSFSPELAGMLGFRKKLEVHRNLFVTGEYLIDLNRGISSIFVYTNFITSRIVGNTETKLLRIVPVTGQDSQIILTSYDRIHYFQISTPKLNHIHIALFDSTGATIPFRRGNLSVTLHIRKKSI